MRVAKAGDPVLLSFASCQACRNCVKGHPAYCALFGPLNLMSNSPDYTHSDGFTIGGQYFGQSSFSSMSIVGESSVVNVTDIIKDVEELKLFAPLGCGLQTGSGAITRIAKAQKDDLVAIIGLGGVGFSALMVKHYSVMFIHSAMANINFAGRQIDRVRDHHCNRHNRDTP